MVSTGISFAFTCTCTHFFALYSLLSPSHWYQPSLLGRTCSALLFSDFAKEKREKEKHDIFASL
jgi:hypothetical protein